MSVMPFPPRPSDVSSDPSSVVKRGGKREGERERREREGGRREGALIQSLSLSFFSLSFSLSYSLFLFSLSLSSSLLSLSLSLSFQTSHLVRDRPNAQRHCRQSRCHPSPAMSGLYCSRDPDHVTLVRGTVESGWPRLTCD